ncbi:hypothetical protein BDZ89DRAFT_1216424, partial [Hymenopellis radicata]
MPPRSTKSAPTFSGNPKDLEDYLEDIKRVCEEHGKADEADWVFYALHYLSAEERESWRTLQESKSIPARGTQPAVVPTWAPFVKAVMEIYPGAQMMGRYELTDLEHLVLERARNPPEDLQTLRDFTRSFKRIGTLLIDEDVVSASELSRMYVKGLGAGLRECVNRCLEIKHPDHHPLRPHLLAHIIKEAEFCLS